jgi:hypothetical protein
MKIKLAFGVFLAALLFGGQAMACSVMPNEETSTERGPNCAVTYIHKGEYGQESLTEAEDIGNGLVLQYYGTMTACGYAKMALVTDCQAAQSLVVGYEVWNFNGAQSDVLTRFEQIVRKRAAHGAPEALKDLQGQAAGKFEEIGIYPILDRLRLSIGVQKPRHTYNISCGCKAFYPDLPGAGG